MSLGPNEPTQAVVRHAHGIAVHSHGVIGAGQHEHPGTAFMGRLEYRADALDWIDTYVEDMRAAVQGAQVIYPGTAGITRHIYPASASAAAAAGGGR